MNAKNPYRNHELSQENPIQSAKYADPFWVVLGRFETGSGTVAAQFSALTSTILGGRFRFCPGSRATTKILMQVFVPAAF